MKNLLIDIKDNIAGCIFFVVVLILLALPFKWAKNMLDDMIRG